MTETAHDQPLPEPQTPLWLPALGVAVFAFAGIAWAVCPEPAPPPAAAAPVATVVAPPPTPAPTQAPQPAVTAVTARPFPAASGSAGVRPARGRPAHPLLQH